MNRKTIFSLAGVILLTSVILYYVLGGFRAVEYTVIPDCSYLIIGKEYTGVNNSAALENLFDETKELLKRNFSDGTLIIVSDEEKYDDENNQVGYFVGILVRDIPESLPSGYSLKEYGPSKVIRAKIDLHNLVMPKPDKVRKSASGLAESEGAVLSNFSFEKYLEEGSIEVDFLVNR